MLLRAKERAGQASKETAMKKLLKSRSATLVLSLAIIGAGALWATSAVAARTEKAMLPDLEGQKAACPEDGIDHPEMHNVRIDGVGEFQEITVEGPSQIMVELDRPFQAKSGLKTVPFTIVSIGGRAFAEGIGETKF